MRRGNQRIRKARAAKRRWLVAEHLTRAGDAAGPHLMEVLVRTHQDRQHHKMLKMPAKAKRFTCVQWTVSQMSGIKEKGAQVTRAEGGMSYSKYVSFDR